MPIKHESCQTVNGLFAILNQKLWQQNSKTILSLQYCKLGKQDEETPKDWMGRLRIMMTYCKYKENDTRTKEQFINGINDKVMTAEILKE